MPAGSRAIATRQRQIAELIQERQEANKRNRSLKLHTRKSLSEAIGWSEETVRDDIRDMRADGHPIRGDARGYAYTEKFSGVPTSFATESDLAHLCLGFRSLEAIKGTSLYKPIQKALDKMTRSLIDKFGVDVEALKSTVTFRSTGVDTLADIALIETLMHAINKREELEIAYSKLNYEDLLIRNPGTHEGKRKRVQDAEAFDCSNGALSPSCPPTPAPEQPTTIPFPNAPWLQLPIENRRVHPLHLHCQDNAWYLWLWDPIQKDKNRSFSLSRIRSVTRTGKTFRPRKFDINEELNDTFGITSGEAEDVKIHFRRKASFLVAERPWHHSMKLAPGPDTEWNLELTMHVALTPELINWILRYDEDARVIAPAALRNVIAAKGAGISANYSRAAHGSSKNQEASSK